MSIYEDTYNAVLDLPCVQRIIKKNKKLRKENKALRSLIRSLPEFRQQPHCCASYNDCSHDEPVKIKIEPGSIAPALSVPALSVPVSTVQIARVDDIKIIKTMKVNPPENIVYDIEEAEEEEAEEEEAEEEEEEAEEEEEEEEAEEEEAEEEVEEEAEEEEEEEEEEEAEEEEVEAEEEEEDEEEKEEVEEEEEEEEEEVEAEEEEAEVFEITIKGTAYYTTNEVNGVIYAVAAGEEVGDEIGKFVDKKPVFYKK